MTVKVVSDKPVVTKRRICSNCGYELEYTPNDVVKRTSTDYTGSKDTYLELPCPRKECGHPNTLGI